MKKDTPVGESLPLRAALYPRVSTEEQAKYGLSIHDQQGDLEEYARAHGMRIVGVFADAGYSARKKVEKRPAMLALLDDDGNVDAVSVVLNTDRADAFYERVLGYIAYALDIGTADDVVSADGGELGGWYIWSSDIQGGGTAMHFIFSDKR